MTRKEFLRQVGREYRSLYDQFFYLAGTQFHTRRPGNQGYKFTNEPDSRTLRSPDGRALIIFRTDRSVFIERYGMEVRFERPEQARNFLEVFLPICHILAREEGVEQAPPRPPEPPSADQPKLRRVSEVQD